MSLKVPPSLPSHQRSRTFPYCFLLLSEPGVGWGRLQNFGKSVNPISTRGARLCLPHYYLSLLDFQTFLRPCSFSPDGDLATQERWMRDLAEDFGNFGKILGWYRGPRPVIYATNPDFLKEVFIKESETYIDRPMLDRSDNVPHLIMLKGDYYQKSAIFLVKSQSSEF